MTALRRGLLPINTPSVANLRIFVKTEIARWATVVTRGRRRRIAMTGLDRRRFRAHRKRWPRLRTGSSRRKRKPR